MQLYNQTSFACSKLITNKYSTSFSKAIKAFHKRFREPIYGIYGFVRYADEIVDTFHDYNKPQLIADFKRDTYFAIRQKISLNPVLQSFQQVVNDYQIDQALIEAFFRSMEMDLNINTYNAVTYRDYIYGSAEVIGMMCLRIFTEHNDHLYQQLLPYARRLGAAFQKVNFLRDMQADYVERGRTYFPGVDFVNFSEASKRQIEAEIKADFDEGFKGIKRLPVGSRLGVYIAYVYYRQLFKKITLTPASSVLQKRIRVSDAHKLGLYVKAVLHQKFNAI